MQTLTKPGALAVAVLCFLSPGRATADDLLTVDQARRYLVELINRDRASQGLAPVTLDEGPPTVAAQRQADDMATHHFKKHYGTDGSLPYQRYTEAGGRDYNEENVGHLGRGANHPLPAQIPAADIERLEGDFFNETPPNDGHRRNILDPWHKTVGIGLRQDRWVEGRRYKTYLAVVQEFVNPYGTYSALPKTAHVGDQITVSGELNVPARVAEIGLERMELPHPLDVATLETMGGYPAPHADVKYWPSGKSPRIEVNGQRFSITVPLSVDGQPGLYVVSIWAKFPEQNKKVLVSSRTILVQ